GPRTAFVDMEQVVEALEPSVPGGQGMAGWRRATGPQLVDPEAERADRPERAHHGQGNDRLARPAGEVIDVQGEPGREEDHLGRKSGQLLPGPQPEKGQPQPGEDAGTLEAAAVQDELSGRSHVV